MPNDNGSVNTGLSNIDMMINIRGRILNRNNDFNIFNPSYGNAFTAYYNKDNNSLNIEYYFDVT